jgi:two-component system response regulator (stage 0 sporulation protein A)
MNREVSGPLEMRKLLIADTVEEFCQTLADQLRGTFRIKICHDGPETLDLILSFKPDFLVLDMMLPGLDGITILEEAAALGVRPVVLAVTKDPSDYVVRSATRLGVGYMMVKPCKIKATVTRLQDLAEYLQPQEVIRQDPRIVVSNVLLALGISTKLRGYAYLREAILEMINSPGQSVTKELYPTVGKMCNASDTQVERSIRSAILKAWNQRDETVWRQYFQPSSAELLERPTNAVFISSIADRISMDIFGGNL